VKSKHFILFFGKFDCLESVLEFFLKKKKKKEKKKKREKKKKKKKSQTHSLGNTSKIEIYMSTFKRQGV